VNLPAYITESHLRRAKTSSTGDYAVAADLYQEYARCFLRDDWRRRVARNTRRVLPLPAELTAESEIWVQIGAELARAGDE
jgi:hypothetical protein